MTVNMGCDTDVVLVVMIGVDDVPAAFNIEDVLVMFCAEYEIIVVLTVLYYLIHNYIG